MTDRIEYTTNENTLTIRGANRVAIFPWPIAEIVEFDEILVIRLEPAANACFNENVFGVQRDGRTGWQIVELKHVYADSPYTSIRRKDSSVLLSNWDGDELLVEPISGSIISKFYSK